MGKKSILNIDYPPSILPPVRRIIAIGDLHGDYKATITCLRKAKLIDEKNIWTGNDTVVIQMGDQVDRGGRSVSDEKDEDSEFRIMNLFDKLHKQAKKSGGAVYSLIGNHELMNVMGDFSYTSKMGIKHFGSEEERYQCFKPGARIAKKMAKNRNVIMKIGDWIFVHGGITTRIAEKFKLPDINTLMRRYLMGESKLEFDRNFRELFLNNGSLLWTRRFSDDKPDCKNLFKTLYLMGGKKLVVAHTPQGTINCKCKKTVWRIDTGMSRAFGKDNSNNRIQVLEILNNGKIVNII